MKTFIHLALAVSLTLCARAEMRTWTSLSGKTIEAEYVKILFDDIILKDANGGELRLPVNQLSGEDLKYIELANPPELSVDFRKSANQDFVPTSPFNTVDPPILLTYRFGGRVKQKDAKSYEHPLKMEIYTFTQQRYDPNKYHLIAKIESEPFVLSGANDRRYEFMDANDFRLISYDLNVEWLNWQEPRGEKFAESLVLVLDERGEIIAYNTTKNWLYNNLEKLQELPVGAWLNDDCTRVHPTPPKSTKRGTFPF